MEARDLTEVEMRMGWLLSWRQVAVETALFFQTDRQAGRQAGTWGLSAECVNMKGVCGYETVATTPTHTHTLYTEEWHRWDMVQSLKTAVSAEEMRTRAV